MTEHNEQMLTKVFDNWRAEFRRILEDHRREIQTRLEKIEIEIEKKSDKENVELLARSIHDELRLKKNGLGKGAGEKATPTQGKINDQEAPINPREEPPEMVIINAETGAVS